MDVLDRLRLGEGQQVVVALEGAGATVEAGAAELRLAEAEALDLGAHRAVENEDALARGLGERARDVAARFRGGGGEQVRWVDAHGRASLETRYNHISISLCQRKPIPSSARRDMPCA